VWQRACVIACGVAITDDDLLGLALELAQWGVRDASELRFLTPPPAGALDAARALLRDFGALDEALGITAHGRKLAGTPFHDPTLLNERALGKRLAAFRKRGDRGAKEALARIKPKPDQTLAHLGVLLATGFPDRIARRRKGGGPDHGARYLMASGKGAVLPLDDALAGEEWLAIGELDGNPREAAVRLAAPLTAADVVLYCRPSRKRTRRKIRWPPLFAKALRTLACKCCRGRAQQSCSKRGWFGQRRKAVWMWQLDQLAPETYLAPTGRKVAIDYSGAAPMVAIRLQEMFGLTTHPVLGLARIPLVFELLSPAGRPLQKTADLPGFWQSSYSDVRKDMRARYPKHPWPENPAEAAPTRRAKPRKN